MEPIKFHKFKLEPVEGVCKWEFGVGGTRIHPRPRRRCWGGQNTPKPPLFDHRLAVSLVSRLAGAGFWGKTAFFGHPPGTEWQNKLNLVIL